MNEYTRPATQDDVEFITKHMRVEDIAECLAGGITHRDALHWGRKLSTKCLTLVDPKTGNPGAMLGTCAKDELGFGKVWLLGTSAIESNTKTFLRYSKPILEELEEGYTALYNYTYVGNTVHHRWLKWLGFKFLRLVELQPDRFFYEFVKLRS